MCWVPHKRFGVLYTMRVGNGLFGFYFLKLFYVLKNKENRDNAFDSQFFFFALKNTGIIENIKFRE